MSILGGYYEDKTVGKMGLENAVENKFRKKPEFKFFFQNKVLVVISKVINT